MFSNNLSFLFARNVNDQVSVPLSHKVYEMEVLKFHHPLRSFQIDKIFVLTASGCIGVAEYSNSTSKVNKNT